MKVKAIVMGKKVMKGKDDKKYYTLEVYVKSPEKDGFLSKIFVDEEVFSKISEGAEISNNLGLQIYLDRLDLVYIK